MGRESVSGDVLMRTTILRMRSTSLAVSSKVPLHASTSSAGQHRAHLDG